MAPVTLPWVTAPSRTSLNTVAKRKNHCPCWELNLGHSAHSLVTILTELNHMVNTQLLQGLTVGELHRRIFLIPHIILDVFITYCHTNIHSKIF
jgi:hypothetical protein